MCRSSGLVSLLLLPWSSFRKTVLWYLLSSSLHDRHYRLLNKKYLSSASLHTFRVFSSESPSPASQRRIFRCLFENGNKDDEESIHKSNLFFIVTTWRLSRVEYGNLVNIKDIDFEIISRVPEEGDMITRYALNNDSCAFELNNRTFSLKSKSIGEDPKQNIITEHKSVCYQKNTKRKDTDYYNDTGFRKLCSGAWSWRGKCWRTAAWRTLQLNQNGHN